MKKKITSLLLLVSLISTVSADEPLWTDEQRLDKRDIVCIATVVSTQRISKVDQHNDLYLAVLKVEGMKKGWKTSVGSTLPVYYEFSLTGENIRCPTYAELEKGDRGTFYLQKMTDDIRKQLGLKEAAPTATFLEIGSDVKKTNTNQSLELTRGNA